VNLIELTPTLDHCIEATAREEFQNSMSRYLASGLRDGALEEKLDLLKAFLESADFPGLRSQSERYLTAGISVTFVIWREEGVMHYEIVVGENQPGPGDRPQRQRP
jgi:hypothetical protein